MTTTTQQNAPTSRLMLVGGGVGLVLFILIVWSLFNFAERGWVVTSVMTLASFGMIGWGFATLGSTWNDEKRSGWGLLFGGIFTFIVATSVISGAVTWTIDVLYPPSPTVAELEEEAAAELAAVAANAEAARVAACRNPAMDTGYVVVRDCTIVTSFTAGERKDLILMGGIATFSHNLDKWCFAFPKDIFERVYESPDRATVELKSLVPSGTKAYIRTTNVGCG